VSVRFRGSLADIRLFVAAYEEKSFTAAALRENSTQSGVSHHIRQLEQLLGAKLFVRERAGVEVTPAAGEFYRTCVQIIRELDEVAGRISRLSHGHQGSFALGASPVLTHRLLGRALLKYNERNPNVHVRIVECVAEAQHQMIISGQIDFGLGSQPAGGALRSRRLLTTAECIVGNDALSGGTGEIPRGSQIKLVLPILSPKRHAAIAASLAAQGLTIAAELRIDSALAILDLIGRSDWVTVAPCLILDPTDDERRFKLYPLSEQPLNLSIYLIEAASRTMTPEAHAFLELFLEHANNLNQLWSERLPNGEQLPRAQI